jgi:hypothetical protein
MSVILHSVAFCAANPAWRQEQAKPAPHPWMHMSQNKSLFESLECSTGRRTTGGFIKFPMAGEAGCKASFVFIVVEVTQPVGIVAPGRGDVEWTAGSVNAPRAS